MKQYVNLAGIKHVWDKIVATFVKQEAGKGLSTNDYTTAEKTKLSGIETGANKYVHPTTAGNKHIPAGGSAGQILKYSSAGTAAWADPDTVTVDDALSETSTNPVQNKVIAGKVKTIETDLSAATKKLSGIAEGANKTVVDTALSATSTNPVQNKAVQAKVTEIETTLGTATTKLDGIEEGANKTVVDAALSASSANPVQNKAVNTALGKKIDTAKMGVANGVATLDASGLIPSDQLPSYVDDVIEGYYVEADNKFYSDSAHKTAITGETGKIYVDLNTNLSYRYGGTAYVLITSTDMTPLSDEEIDAVLV